MADVQAVAASTHHHTHMTPAFAGNTNDIDDDFETPIFVRSKPMGKLKERKKKALAQEFATAVENGEVNSPKSKHNFRPRPVEVGDELPVVRLSAQDAAGSECANIPMSAPVSSETLPLVAAPSATEVYIPHVRRLPTVQIAGHAFQQPKSRIHYQVPTKEELDARVLYDLDDEDFEWLKRFNTDNKRNVCFL